MLHSAWVGKGKVYLPIKAYDIRFAYDLLENSMGLCRRGLVSRRKAKVRAPGQTLKQNTKSISLPISSLAKILRANETAMKSFSKNL